MLLDGDTERFVTAGGDALYDVDRDAAGHLLVSPPSVLAGLVSPDQFLDEPYPPTPEGAQSRARHRVHRRLLTEAALYYEYLPDDERDYARRGGGGRPEPASATSGSTTTRSSSSPRGGSCCAGPNGSGKSNALALLVPFLLDGVMAAYRMDSLSGGRSMKTLLLCLAEDERSSRFRHEQRTGYVWLEFERGSENITIGLRRPGLRPTRRRSLVLRDPRRPGIDLDLAPGGVPLSKGGLTERLGPPPSTIRPTLTGRP